MFCPAHTFAPPYRPPASWPRSRLHQGSLKIRPFSHPSAPHPYPHLDVSELVGQDGKFQGEARHDGKGATAAATRGPEQVSVLAAGLRLHDTAVGQDGLQRDYRVTTEAKVAAQQAKAAAQIPAWRDGGGVGAGQRCAAAGLVVVHGQPAGAPAVPTKEQTPVGSAAPGIPVSLTAAATITLFMPAPTISMVLSALRLDCMRQTCGRQSVSQARRRCRAVRCPAYALTHVCNIRDVDDHVAIYYRRALVSVATGGRRDVDAPGGGALDGCHDIGGVMRKHNGAGELLHTRVEGPEGEGRAHTRGRGILTRQR